MLVREGGRVVLNPNKNCEFNLDDHKARTSKVFADFENYRVILDDLEKRLEALENSTKEDSDS